MWRCPLRISLATWRGWRRLVAGVLCLACAGGAWAAEFHGVVTFNGLPVPGATVMATRAGKEYVTVTDQQGLYSFADLADGGWKVEVRMTGFAPRNEEVTAGAGGAAPAWELKLLPLAELLAQATALKANPAVAAKAPAAVGGAGQKAARAGMAAAVAADLPKPPDDAAPRPSDGFLINGSSNNAATSQYSLAQAFGNQRSGTKSLYTGGLGFVFDNSALDARPYSISGLPVAKASYNRVTGTVTVGGPINLPRFVRRGPNFFLAYQWTRDRDAAVDQGLVPTLAERAGDLSGLPGAVFDPVTAASYPGNVVPVSAQARALLGFYPLPNVAGNSRYNYQTSILNSTHRDALQLRMDKSIGRKNQFYGGLALQSTRGAEVNLFGFNDRANTLGLNSNVNWNHRFNQRLYGTLTYRFSRLRTQVVPEFAGRTNVSGAAGIAAAPAMGGNDQDAAEFGPPTLNFASGITPLGDAESAFNRNRTDEVSLSANVYRGKHNITVGGSFRRQEFNVFGQQDARGTYTFTGAATASKSAIPTGGSDFADFLVGVPDTASIAFGNPDKYLRQSVYAGYLTDDWRLRPELTINAGVRWEYGAPITELHDRLVNLDVAAGGGSAFGAVAPVLASQPQGSLTGQAYPTSLIRPTKNRFEPRVGVSWRPIPGSTLVVRAGYGVYDDTSVYEATALLLAQQAPLSKSVAVANGAGCALTLAAGFLNCGAATADTFAVDPNFRVGYAQTWQLLLQRDLPFALQGTATYLGIKGTRGVQEFLPNTYPVGATNPCPACPLGFVYRTSNGNSTRESVQLQLRRRLRAGFTASVQYTYSKSIDDDSALGGQGPVSPGATTQATANATIAQDWRNLRGERGLSSFDQRHLLNASVQYTSGQGLGGGALLEGWRGKLLKEWTVLTTIVAGSGLPETPVFYASVPGTGFTGSIRPNYTGSSKYAAPAGLHLNPGAYTAPAVGQWGSAGRNSILGPGQFTLNSSMSRTFRLKGRYNLDARLDSTNLLNKAVFTGWNTIINNTEYGLPVAANPMRSLQVTARLRF